VPVLVAVLSFNAGARTERARAKHGREERRETERRELHNQGAAAIADATRDLDAVNPEWLQELPHEERVATAASAPESWRRATSVDFMRIAAAHPDDAAV
jgi:hypothetical protein